VAGAAVDVVVDVVLVGVDVTRLPEAIAPLGQQRGEPGRVQVPAQPRRRGRIGEEPQAQRPGARTRRDDAAVVAELEAHPVAVALCPDAVAARGLQPRRGRVVALRDAADGEHLARAVGSGVRTVGAELDLVPGVVDAQRVARAQPGEALLGPGVPVGGQAQRLAVERELEEDGLRRGQRDPQPPAAPALAADGELGAVGQALGDAHRDDALGDLELLGRDDPLGELDELVADRAVGAPEAEPAQEPAAAAAHVDAERVLRDLDLDGLALEEQAVRHRCGVNRYGAELRDPAREPASGSHEGNGTVPSRSRGCTRSGRK
jgi:hypothetical protein